MIMKGIFKEESRTNGPKLHKTGMNLNTTVNF